MFNFSHSYRNILGLTVSSNLRVIKKAISICICKLTFIPNRKIEEFMSILT